MFGFGTATVNAKLQLCKVEIYYDAEEFIATMKGETKVEDSNKAWNSGGTCPHFATLQKKE